MRLDSSSMMGVYSDDLYSYPSPSTTTIDSDVFTFDYASVGGGAYDDIVNAALAFHDPVPPMSPISPQDQQQQPLPPIVSIRTYPMAQQNVRRCGSPAYGYELSQLIRSSPTNLLGHSNYSQEENRQGCFGHLSVRETCGTSYEISSSPVESMRNLEQTSHPYTNLSGNQVVLPQQEGELISSYLIKCENSNGSVSGTCDTPKIATTPVETFTFDTSCQAPSPELTEEEDGPNVCGPLECRWIDCYSVFSDQESLVRHIEKCHVESRKGEDFSCFWQGCMRRWRPFNARYKLLIHMRVHSGDKPNKCPFEGCTKAFSRLENLKIHHRSHTGERPYSCQYAGCHKAFSNSSDRAKHQRTHFDTKPYACQVNGCTKRYTDPSSLRKHVKHHANPDHTPTRKKVRNEENSNVQNNRTNSNPETNVPNCFRDSIHQITSNNVTSNNIHQNIPQTTSHYVSEHEIVSEESLPMPSLSDSEFSYHLQEELSNSEIPTTTHFDDLEYIPYESVRKLLGDSEEYIDTFQGELDLETDLEQHILELTQLNN